MPRTKRTSPAKQKSKPAEPSKPAQAIRFAHPFFDTLQPDQRASTGPFGRRMLDHIRGTLHPIPPVRGSGRLTLADVIGNQGSDAIALSHQITLHIAGDTGVPETDHETKQVMVADAMAKDYDPAHPETSPAFFLHVGDVIYGPAPGSYLDQFYRPNMHYPGKIVAIPGNHDGESDVKIRDFQKYFCAAKQKVPPIAGSIFRQTMTLPGVYWCLDAPFLQIVGLYSNSAENPGFISGPSIGQVQKKWLVKTLSSLRASRAGGVRKALMIITHHPPFSSGGHSGSTQMLADIDDACTKAGIMPDAFFSGHAHSIQRYTRTVQFGGRSLRIPYVVTGCAGHGGQAVAPPPAHKSGNPEYDFSYEGWGYTKVQVTAHDLKILSYGVDAAGARLIDTFQTGLA
ncbi:MAG TPA: metallophosphoesterase [Bacteroidota bacterium]|nr:metallophosphoesterase [Bacteroidota bacterium]